MKSVDLTVVRADRVVRAIRTFFYGETVLFHAEAEIERESAREGCVQLNQE